MGLGWVDVEEQQRSVRLQMCFWTGPWVVKNLDGYQNHPYFYNKDSIQCEINVILLMESFSPNFTPITYIAAIVFSKLVNDSSRLNMSSPGWGPEKTTKDKIVFEKLHTEAKITLVTTKWCNRVTLTTAWITILLYPKSAVSGTIRCWPLRPPECIWLRLLESLVPHFRTL